MSDRDVKERELISTAEAAEEVKLAYRRIGLLHLAYAETLTEKLGEEEGKALILEAIRNYGRKIGEKVREQVLDEGLEPEPENFGKGSSRNLPRFGINDGMEEVESEGEKRLRTYGCGMAKVWKEYGQEALGKLYCFVDPAKYMAYNPDYKMVHTCNELCQDDCCEFAVRKTTEKDKKDFAAGGSGWTDSDDYLK